MLRLKYYYDKEKKIPKNILYVFDKKYHWPGSSLLNIDEDFSILNVILGRVAAIIRPTSTGPSDEELVDLSEIFPEEKKSDSDEGINEHVMRYTPTEPKDKELVDLVGISSKKKKTKKKSDEFDGIIKHVIRHVQEQVKRDRKEYMDQLKLGFLKRKKKNK